MQILTKKVDKLYLATKTNSKKLDLILKLLKGSDNDDFQFETTTTINELKNLNQRIEEDESFAAYFVSLM